MSRLVCIFLHGCLLIPQKADTSLPGESAPVDAESGAPDSAADDTGAAEDTGETGCPGGTEEIPYDDVDNDCDEQTPDDDLDSDGYEEAEDCDDGDSTVFPGAEEQCEDGLVNDCDGDAAGAFGTCGPIDPANLGEVALKISGEAIGDYAGYAVSDAGDIDGDGLGDLLIGAIYEENGAAGAAYLLLGKGALNGASGELSLSEADVELTGESSGGYAGCAVSAAGDIDGDGLGDLLVGGNQVTYYEGTSGIVYLLLGGETLEGAAGALNLSGSDFRFLGLADSYAGVSVASAGDVDGDELDDVLIGASMSSTSSYRAGSAFLILATDLPVGGSGILELSLDVLELTGEDEDDHAGHSVSDAGDVDGDGLADVLVGAFKRGVDESQSGAAYLLYGGGALDTSLSAMDLADADVKLDGVDADDRAGISVSGAGDVDGDGLADVLVGAYRADTGGTGGGTVYLLLGGGVLLDLSGTIDLSESDIELKGESADGAAGWSVSDAGDVDADGLDDLLIGDISNGAGGSAFLALGGGALLGRSGQLSLEDADLELVGQGVGDGAGYSVSGAGDIDGDGFDELLIGAYYNDSGTGAAYLVMGGGY